MNVRSGTCFYIFQEFFFVCSFGPALATRAVVLTAAAIGVSATHEHEVVEAALGPVRPCMRP